MTVAVTCVGVQEAAQRLQFARYLEALCHELLDLKHRHADSNKALLSAAHDQFNAVKNAVKRLTRANEKLEHCRRTEALADQKLISVQHKFSQTLQQAADEKTREANALASGDEADEAPDHAAGGGGGLRGFFRRSGSKSAKGTQSPIMQQAQSLELDVRKRTAKLSVAQAETAAAEDALRDAGNELVMVRKLRDTELGRIAAALQRSEETRLSTITRCLRNLSDNSTALLRLLADLQQQTCKVIADADAESDIRMFVHKQRVTITVQRQKNDIQRARDTLHAQSRAATAGRAPSDPASLRDALMKSGVGHEDADDAIIPVTESRDTIERYSSEFMTAEAELEPLVENWIADIFSGKGQEDGRGLSMAIVRTQAALQMEQSPKSVSPNDDESDEEHMPLHALAAALMCGDDEGGTTTPEQGSSGTGSAADARSADSGAIARVMFDLDERYVGVPDDRSTHSSWVALSDAVSPTGGGSMTSAGGASVPSEDSSGGEKQGTSERAAEGVTESGGDDADTASEEGSSGAGDSAEIDITGGLPIHAPLLGRASPAMIREEPPTPSGVGVRRFLRDVCTESPVYDMDRVFGCAAGRFLFTKVRVYCM